MRAWVPLLLLLLSSVPVAANVTGARAVITDAAGNKATLTTVGASVAQDVNVVQLVPDTVATATLTALNQTVAATSTGGHSTWTVDVRTGGTWTAGTTVVFESSVDGTNYLQSYGVQLNTDMGTPNNGISGPGPASFQGTMAGSTLFRVRVSSFTASESVIVTIRLSATDAVFGLKTSLPFGTNQIGKVVTSVSSSGTPTQTSVSCGTGSTTLLAAATATQFISVRNPTTSTQTVWLNLAGAAAVAAAPSIDIPPGGERSYFNSENSYLPTSQLNCIAGTASTVTLVYK